MPSRDNYGKILLALFQKLSFFRLGSYKHKVFLNDSHQNAVSLGKNVLYALFVEAFTINIEVSYHNFDVLSTTFL